MASTSMIKSVRPKKPTARKKRKEGVERRPGKVSHIIAKPTEVNLKKPKEVDLKQMLALRKKIAAGRPKFTRQESWRYGRVKKEWRMPKGIDSKMRLQVKGWPKIVKVGYRGPAAVRGIHPSGFRDVLIYGVKELQALNPKRDAARLASTLGARKRELLLSKAKELGIRILNPTGLRLRMGGG